MGESTNPRGKLRFDRRIPLFVGQVAGVWFAFHTSILMHVQDFSHTL